MKESDWKIFKIIREKALEKYCAGVLEDCLEILNNNEESSHERFLLLYKLIMARDKKLGFIFDYLSRSKAPLQLMLMRKEGLDDKRLLKKLSDEFLQETKPARFK